jgi:hypothetical protein
MSQHYSDPSRESDPHALPDVWVTQLTAEEIAGNMEDEIYDYMKRPEFRLASMNTRTRDKMIETMIEELEIKGGWCWYYCMPGCMPDSGPYGPFTTRAEAIADMYAQQDWSTMEGMREWSSGSGRLSLWLTADDAESASHQGQCDDDVAGLAEVPYVAQQLSEWKPEHVRDELKEYGAWDETELADDAQNLQRMLWLAASDIRENATSEE